MEILQKLVGWVNEKGEKLKVKLNGKSICGGYILEKNIVYRA